MIAAAVHGVRRRARAAALVTAVLCSILAGCDDAHVVACFGDQDFCKRVITANVPPEADAGSDQEVAGGERVSLDGTGSSDPDGHISSYSWTQLSGMAVTLLDADQATARFDAPAVGAPETLIFRLTVVDDDQAASEDDVAVVVVPAVAAAVRRGLDLLSRSVVPAPVLVPQACSPAPSLGGAAWFAQAGLWLTANAAGLDGADPDAVTGFLDAARTVLAEGERRIPADGLGRALWLQGLEALRHFAHGRDPAVAAWAAQSRPAAADVPALIGRLTRGEIMLALAGEDAVAVEADPARSLQRSTDFLQTAACRGGLDPIRLAADTVFLLGRQGRGI